MYGLTMTEPQYMVFALRGACAGDSMLQRERGTR
jgi:hypothetical protein